MAGSRVESISVITPGSGLTQSPTVSLVGSGGSGAAAVAYAYTGALRPVSFFKGRYNDVYGVDGMARGFRWDGVAATVQPIGLLKPYESPTITARSAGLSRISDIHLIREGAGYFSPPTVTISGTAARTASATATVFNGRVVSIGISDPGSGYSSTPTVLLTGGVGGGESLNVGVVGRIDSIETTATGSGYTDSGTQAATLSLATSNGLTSFSGIVVVSASGEVTGVTILSSGTGATGPVTATVNGGIGSGAAVKVNMAYRVSSVTATSGGAGYYVPPVVTVLPNSADRYGFGAAVTCQVAGGVIQSPLTVVAGGSYLLPPTAEVLDTQAEAMATVAAAVDGEYKCCYRYIDDTPVSQGGPRASSISDLKTIEAEGGGFNWSLPTSSPDGRATKVELWRTTSGQSVVLFRVATISIGDLGPDYVDTLTDEELRDTERDGYGLMPITLPSGQINARRFEVPPAEFAVACMFQDRVWFAVDTTGERPNTLMYSEIDEPESVPAANEIVVQENIGDSDKIVALIPFGSQLLVAQQSHIYALAYVAQPVIDASLRLVGYRGVLNKSCWAVVGGVAFMADSFGIYAFDGQSEGAISVPVDDYWRDGKIDFTQADKFHLMGDLSERVVRFFYCQAGDTEPTRALCYSMATKSWWEEAYPTAITATCQASIESKMDSAMGTSAGGISHYSGLSDSGTAIPYKYRTGPLPLNTEKGSRSVIVVYDPTASTASLGLGLHFNNSDTPRPNAISSDRGSGFVATQGSTTATLDMALSRSSLGDATGTARAYYSGRVDDRSAGNDRHMAVDLSGTQSANPVRLHGLVIEGAG